MDGKEVQVFRGQTLEQIISPLSAIQQDYLVMRIRGVSNRDTLIVLQRKYNTVSSWETREPYFQEASEWLFGHADIYYEQALRFANGDLEIIDWGLRKFAMKILDFDNPKQKMTKDDKKLVLKAVEMLHRVHPTRASLSDLPNETYDEMIVRVKKPKKLKEAEGDASG